MIDTPPSAKDDLQRLVASGALTSARSPIYLWMWRNYAGLTAKLDGARVHWPTFAASLADLGVVDGNGAPPKAETVRRSWWRVRKAKEAARDRAAPRRQLSQAEPLSVPVETAPSVRLLTPPEPEKPVQATSTPAESANADLARIRAEMNRRSGR